MKNVEAIILNLKALMITDNDAQVHQDFFNKAIKELVEHYNQKDRIVALEGALRSCAYKMRADDIRNGLFASFELEQALVVLGETELLAKIDKHPF